MDGITVISCFDGYAGALEALKRVGIPVSKYYAFENDKWAIQVAKKNHPEIIHLGDFTDPKWKIPGRTIYDPWRWNTDLLPKPDLLAGGPPCQGFSIAGKRLNFEDPRSRLFLEFIQMRDHLISKHGEFKWIFENVTKIQKDALILLNDLIGIQPLQINSALVSAQNRERFYWTNIGTVQDMHGREIPGIPQPEDRKIFLKDIIEGGYVDRDKSLVLTASYRFSPSHKEYTEKRKKQIIYATKRNGRLIEREDQKSTCLDVNYYKGIDNHGARTCVVFTDRHGIKINNQEKASSLTHDGACTWSSDGHSGPLMVGVIRGLGHDMIRRVYDPAGKSPTLLAKPRGGSYPPKIIKDGILVGKGHEITRRIYNTSGKSPTLTTNSGGGLIPKISVTYGSEWKEGTLETGEAIYYRRLSVIECERLQTLPDGYCAGVSNTQAYKMIGNGFNIETVAHILGFMRTTK